MSYNTMIIKSKAMLGKREITVTHHLPEGQKTLDMIANALINFYKSNLKPYFEDDEIDVLFPIFYPLVLKIEDLKKENYTKEDINKIILDDFQKEIKKRSKLEQKNINAALYYSHRRNSIKSGM